MKIRLIIFILFVAPATLYAQDDLFEVYDTEEDASDSYGNPYIVDTRTSDYANVDTSFKSRYRGKEYDYTEKIKEKKPKPKPKKRRSFTVGFGNSAMVIFYVFLTIAGALIIYLLFKSYKDFKFEKREKTKPLENAVENESNIEKAEKLDKPSLKAQIEEAKKDENYPLAIRLYFLLYLEHLQQKGILSYHRDKTNQEYIAEMEKDDDIAQFLKLSYPFEFVWYGKKPIDKASFEVLENLFNQQLSTKK